MQCRKLACGIVAGLALSCLASLAAAVELPKVIGDNMVLQRGQAVPVWG